MAVAPPVPVIAFNPFLARHKTYAAIETIVFSAIHP